MDREETVGEKRGMGESMIMQVIRRAAWEDWFERHICLPSLAAAVIMEGIGNSGNRRLMEREPWKALRGCFQSGEEKPYPSLKQAVVLHNDYLAEWRAEEQEKPNWHRLTGENNYIRAVQYLQDADYPYCTEKDYEEKLVGIIERYRLYEMDEDERS